MACEGSFKQNGHNVVVGDSAYFTSYAGTSKVQKRYMYLTFGMLMHFVMLWLVK